MNPAPKLAPLESPAAAPAPDPPQWQAAPKDPMDMVRRLALILAMAFLAISLVVAYYSANSIVSIWFEDRYVPIVRMVLALGIAGVAVWVILRLTQKR